MSKNRTMAAKNSKVHEIDARMSSNLANDISALEYRFGDWTYSDSFSTNYQNDWDFRHFGTMEILTEITQILSFFKQTPFAAVVLDRKTEKIVRQGMLYAFRDGDSWQSVYNQTLAAISGLAQIKSIA